LRRAANAVSRFNVVSDRARRAGEEVARGEVIARIVNPDELEIRLFVPLRHVKAIQPGHVVDVTADRREFTATVGCIVPAGDPRTQSFEVLVKALAVDGDKRAARVPVKAGVADGHWIAVDGSLRAGDHIVVRGGKSLRGKEKLDVVGVFEGEARRVTAERVKPSA
jgi:multidrug efflux pump subunit AcrA (membrane-fusion protein)